MSVRVLLVEDDERLLALVQRFLARSGLEVHAERTGHRALEHIVVEQPDIVVLDLGLPDLDGLEVCRRARPHFAGGILMLTARSEDLDEVRGLETGADDYMAKPVRPAVLLARIRALLRRGARPQQRYRIGDLEVDPIRRSARVGDRPVELTDGEFDVLLVLARHAGTPIDRDALYTELRGRPFDGVERTVDNRISQLRHKLGDDARSPRRIKTVRGVGYLLVAP